MASAGYADVEIVGFEEIHGRLVEEARRWRREFDAAAAEGEAERLEGYLRGRGWGVRRVDLGGVRPPAPVLYVPLDGTVVFVVVFPERWHIIVPDVMEIVESIVERDEGGKYKVIVFYSRKGRLGLATYLYLGFVIEAHGVGILFVNGGYEEVEEILEALKREGRYVPDEEESVDLESLASRA